MNEQIQAQLDRVETALSSLVDSITSYNPSPAAANNLVEADEGLSELLNTLATHQNQWAELQHLQATEEYLAARVKANLRQLAETRKELVHNTPITLPNPEAHPVNYQVLLNFAQSIARYTKPSFAITQEIPQPDSSQATASQGTATNDKDESQPNGFVAGSAMEIDGSQNTATETPIGKAAAAALSEEQSIAAGQVGEFTFVPWPSQEVIKSGALQRIQNAVEQGQNPDVMDLSQRPLDSAANVSDAAPTIEPAVQPETTSAVDRPAQPPRPAPPPQQQPPPSATQDADFDEFDLYDPTQG